MSKREARTDDTVLRRLFRAAVASRSVQVRRRRRRLVGMCGHVVRVVGLVLAALLFVFGLPILILLASAHGGAVSSALPAGPVTAVIAFPFVLILIGTVLVSGQKRTILFLRRFGNPELSERIRGSLEELLHWHYRLVALDDSTLAPMGEAGRRFRRTVIFFAAMVLLIALAIGTLIVWARYTEAGFTVGGQDVPAAWAAIAAVIMLIPIGVAAVLMVPSVYLLRGRVRRAAHFRVKSADNLALAARKVRRQKNWLNSLALTSPQALILGTSDDLWRPTVSALLPIVDVIIVDVSEPTESIAWEIDQVFEQSADKCIIIGSRERILSQIAAPPGDIATRILDRIRGAPLVLYEEDAPPDPTELLIALDAGGSRHREADVPRGRFVLTAISGDSADAWEIDSVRTFLDRRYGPTLMTAEDTAADVDANVERLRAEYPRLEVSDLRGLGTVDRMVLIPAEADPLWIRATSRRRTVRRVSAAITIVSLLALCSVAVWTYRSMSAALAYNDLVHRGRDWLDTDPHHAGRLAVAAIGKHESYEAYELLFDALERTRPFVMLGLTLGRALPRADGKAVLGVCAEGACIWDADGQLVHTLRDEQIQAAAWLPDGGVVTVSTNGLLRVWSSEGAVERLRSVRGPLKGQWLSVSADGRYVAFAGARDGDLEVWNLLTDELLPMAMGSLVSAVAWLPGATVMAVLTRNAVLRVDLGEQEAPRRLTVQAPASLSVSHDGRHLVIGSSLPHASVVIDTATFAARPARIASNSVPAFHPHESWFVAQSTGDRTPAVVDHDGSVEYRRQTVRDPARFSFNESGTRLLVGGLGRARLYRLPDWEELLNLGELGGANSTNQLELVGDDRAVMTGLGKSLLQESRLWDLRPQPPRRLHEIPPGAIKSYQWSPDGKRFVVFHEDDLLFEFDRIGNLLQRVELPPSGPAARVAYGSDGRPFPADAGSIQVLGAVPRAAPIGDQPFVRLVGISPTGTTAWQSGKGLTLRRVDNAVLRTIVRDRAVSAVSWNRAENCILIAGDGAVDVIRLDVDQPSVTIVGQSEQAFFDPSETRLVVAGRKSAALHDRAGRQLLRIDAPDVESSLLFRWSPDAKWLVWMSKTGRMRLYNDAGAIVLEEPGTGGESPWTPSGIATWTPDARTLYLDHRHGGPWIWRTGDSKLTKLLETRPYELVGAALSPDGGLLLVNARRGLELWPSEPLMEVAKRRLGYLEAKDRESFKR